MKAIFLPVLILFIPVQTVYGKAANVPVYFVAGSAATGCQILNASGAPRITSHQLEFASGPQVEFLGAQRGIRCEGEETENRLSVFTGKDPAQWRTHLPFSRRIRFRSVYPGIDVVYYGNGSRLEYDFEIAPRADVSRIRLGFGKHSEVKISSAGDLLTTENGSTLTQHRPRVRQGDREIVAKYVIDPGGKAVRIELGKYDRAQRLVIDPVLAWQASIDRAGGPVESVAVDAAGNMWILSDFPGSKTGYTSTFGGGGNSRDAMLLKVDPTGSKLLYAVQIGGNGYDFAYGVAIGNDGSAYIAGSTTSTDFPVTPQAFETSIPSLGQAGFITKLSPAGDALTYSTYLGGTGGGYATAIAVDRDGNAVVAGRVNAPGFPLTTGSWEDHFSYFPLDSNYALRAITGGFVAKLNNTGSALLYSTLVDEMPEGVALTPSGAVYIVGGALPYLPALTQYTLTVGNTADQGMIVTRLTPDGSRADLNIFVGCLIPNYDHAGLIGLDSKSNILVASSTTCATFPAGTNGAFQPQRVPNPKGVLTPQYDGLIVKIAADGSAVLAATFLGGGDLDFLSSLAVAADDSVMVGGGTSSSDFPVTADGLRTKYGGGGSSNAQILGDGFFAQLSPNLDRLIYSTFLGGGGTDNVLAMALDMAGNVYLGGLSQSSQQSAGVFAFRGTGLEWALKLARDSAPPPVIASVTPATLEAGSGAAIQIAGQNFAQNAVVLVNGATFPAVFQSSSQLSVSLNALDVARTGTIELRVLNPGSAASNAYLLTVTARAGENPTPRIDSLLPSGLPVGSAVRNVIVTSSGLLASTTAAINGKARATSLNANSTLTVTLADEDLAAAGALALTLSNPAPGGGVSDAATFLVSPALAPVVPPTLSSVPLAKLPAGSGSATLSILFSGLSPSGVARWNGVDHSINFTDDTFTVTAAELAHAGAATVTVYDRASGLESNPLPFWIPFATDCTDMVWNAATRKLYLSTQKSVIILNPDTGDADVTIPVDIAIIRMAIAPEGTYLFVSSGGTLRRYQILTAAPWLANPVDISFTFAPTDFAAVPGSPGSVAVYSFNGSGEIAIYDGAVKRSATAKVSANVAPRSLQFSDDGKTLYIVTGYSSAYLTTMPVTSSGVGTAVTKTSSNASFSDGPEAARYFQGRIYTRRGIVFDANTMTPIGSVPSSGYMMPLVSAGAIVMLDASSQYSCSLQAFDAGTFMPLWEEHASSGCDVNTLPYSEIFDIGGGRIAFRMTKAYLVKKPGPAPQFSVSPANDRVSATLELGAQWNPENDLAVLTRQTALPVTAFLLPDQPDRVTLGPSYEGLRYWTFMAPGFFDLEPSNTPAAGSKYTGRVAILISNTTNAAVLEPYDLTFVEPYPMQASPSSLSFVWHTGDPAPATQSFSLTKQGKTLAAGWQAAPPSWLTLDTIGNGPPETFTARVNPTGLAPGSYTANMKFAYYSSPAGSVTVPITLTVVGNGPPTITAVQDAESVNKTVVPGEWVAIYGSNLAGSSRIWGAGDFGSGDGLPTQIDGVSVQFGGKAAAVYYVSPGQIDVQVPGGISGSVPVLVSYRGVASAAFAVDVGTHAPSLFVYPAGSNLYAAATHSDGTLIGDPATQPGARKAKAGEQITLYVNGLGPSTSGTLISAPVPYTDPVVVTVGFQSATVGFAGLVGAGLFQINVQLPGNLVGADYPISVTTGGQVSPGRVILPVQ